MTPRTRYSPGFVGSTCSNTTLFLRLKHRDRHRFNASLIQKEKFTTTWAAVGFR